MLWSAVEPPLHIVVLLMPVTALREDYTPVTRSLGRLHRKEGRSGEWTGALLWNRDAARL